MGKMSSDIVVLDGEPGDAKALEANLLRSLRETYAQGENRSFVLVARNSHGELVGGLTVNTSYGWLLVKVLWVADNHRRCGIGYELMTRTERTAIAAGCQGSWLDTSSSEGSLNT